MRTALHLEQSVAHDRITLALATESDREQIYRIRHAVYAEELRQHSANEQGSLRDALDTQNIYLVARNGSELAAFISVTPPQHDGYSFDKYFSRALLPCPVDDELYEIRLLTVLKPHRGRELATLLMYAAFRWVEAHGGRHIVAIGRSEILEMYLKVGLQRLEHSATCGAVTYELLHAEISHLRETLESFRGLIARVESRVNWALNIPFRKPAACFHGGAFFSTIGERFDNLERRHDIINADVLDAWFDPSPKVLAALEEHLPWLLKTSPPTGCDGLIDALAEARGVHRRHVLPGAGSSDLIFRAFREWLAPQSHALILDPTYGEYAHVLEKVIGCTVDRLTLRREESYAVDLDRLRAALADGYDLIVLVNPNSPTGQFIPRQALQELLRSVPVKTRVWIDETYIEYAGPGQSLERFAARSENVIVCKSMSKVYALSGARAAYLCAGAHQVEALRAITPPWVISLPAQVSAVAALSDPDYYAARYAATHGLRRELAAGLASLGWEITPGIANFILGELPASSVPAAEIVLAARAQGLFVRDAAGMGSRFGSRAIRVAVKDRKTNQAMLNILRAVL